MTRKQHRKNKQARLENKRNPDPALEKPIDADPEKVEEAFQNWRKAFLSQFPWHKSFEPQAA